MLNIFSAKQAKQAARSLERFMNAKGHALKLGQALEALAQMSGNKNWAAMSQELTEEVANRELSSMELAHSFDAGDADIRADESDSGGYGPESALTVHTGFELRYPAYREGADLLDYVRVCDPLGREIAYWVCDEWQEDPQLVMGAILGALARGRSHDVGKKDSQQTSTPAPTAQPKIQDVPWQDVTAVLLNEQYFSLRYNEAEQIARLCEEPVPVPDDHPDDLEMETALGLGREEDGVIWDEEVTVAALRRLVWDNAKKAFVDQLNQDEYKFILAMQFGA